MTEEKPKRKYTGGRPVDPNSASQRAVAWLRDHPTWSIVKTAERFGIAKGSVWQTLRRDQTARWKGHRCPVCSNTIRTEHGLTQVAQFISWFNKYFGGKDGV